MVSIRKCAIIGCGFVGTTIAYTLMQDGLFSEMVLIDINHKKAEGEAMDLSHSVPFTKPIKIYAGSYDDLADCAIIIIAAGANQKPEETRIDLVGKNAEIFKSIIPQITKRNQECILLVVTNPVDILTYLTQKLSGFPANRVIGSGTVLDTARLKYLLGQHLEVDSRNVHAFIIGEHGDTELPVWSSANVSGIDLKDFCSECGKCDDMDCIHQIYLEVKNSAYKVINNKGATYYAIALAVQRIVEAIIRDENSVLTVSSLVNGHYGLDDIYIGLPAIIGRSGVKKLLDIPLNRQESENLVKSVSALRKVLDQILPTLP